jgi:hypothetical protein
MEVLHPAEAGEIAVVVEVLIGVGVADRGGTAGGDVGG